MLYDFLQHLHQLGPQYLISPCCISYLCLLTSPYLLFHSISTDFDSVHPHAGNLGKYDPSKSKVSFALPVIRYRQVIQFWSKCISAEEQQVIFFHWTLLVYA